MNAGMEDKWTEAVDWFHIRVRDAKNFIRRNALPVLEFSVVQNRSITSQSKQVSRCIILINVERFNFSLVSDLNNKYETFSEI